MEKPPWPTIYRTRRGAQTTSLCHWSTGGLVVHLGNQTQPSELAKTNYSPSHVFLPKRFTTHQFDILMDWWFAPGSPLIPVQGCRIVRLPRQSRSPAIGPPVSLVTIVDLVSIILLAPLVPSVSLFLIVSLAPLNPLVSMVSLVPPVPVISLTRWTWRRSL